jgi:hypothetical protein
MTTTSYETRGGLRVQRTVEALPVLGSIDPLVDALDQRRGVLLASSYEYPGRYTRWDMGFVDPPLALVAQGRGFASRRSTHGAACCYRSSRARSAGWPPSIASAPPPRW